MATEDKPIKSDMKKHPKAADHSAELPEEQSLIQFTTPGFVRQFVDKDENKQNLVRLHHRRPGAHSNLQLFNSSDDQLSRIIEEGKAHLKERLVDTRLREAVAPTSFEADNEILAKQQEPKHHGYHSPSIPYLHDNARMISYSENTFKPTFDSREKEMAYRSRIYWRCYFNAISCF